MAAQYVASFLRAMPLHIYEQGVYSLISYQSPGIAGAVYEVAHNNNENHFNHTESVAARLGIELIQISLA